MHVQPSFAGLFWFIFFAYLNKMSKCLIVQGHLETSPPLCTRPIINPHLCFSLLLQDPADSGGDLPHPDRGHRRRDGVRGRADHVHL